MKAETGNKSPGTACSVIRPEIQFVHRFVTFKQNTHLNKAVAANSGWYTVPDVQVEYPYGLKNSGYTDNTPLHLFGSSLIVALEIRTLIPMIIPCGMTNNPMPGVVSFCPRRILL
ncbi:MAG: hypothetical protein ACLTZT_12545 [Butyricimonas faecalis]